MNTIEERAHDYMFNEHISPLNDVLHQCDLKTEMQYHKDIESSYVSAAMTQQEIDIDIFEDFIHDNFGTGDMEWYEAKGRKILMKMMKGKL